MIFDPVKYNHYLWHRDIEVVLLEYWIIIVDVCDLDLYQGWRSRIGTIRHSDLEQCNVTHHHKDSGLDMLLLNSLEMFSDVNRNHVHVLSIHY